jgi:tRNA-dihydrouridine synthase
MCHDLFDAQAPEIPNGSELIEMVRGHYQAMLGFYGTDLGLRVARKHLGWYMDEAGTPAPLRRAVLTSRDTDEVLRLLGDALCRGAEVAA